MNLCFSVFSLSGRSSPPRMRFDSLPGCFSVLAGDTKDNTNKHHKLGTKIHGMTKCIMAEQNVAPMAVEADRSAAAPHERAFFASAERMFLIILGFALACITNTILFEAPLSPARALLRAGPSSGWTQRSAPEPEEAHGAVPLNPALPASKPASTGGARVHRVVQHVCTCISPTSPDELRADTDADGIAGNVSLKARKEGRFVPARPQRSAIRWLHVPKTGTSFISTLWSHGCSRRGSIDLDVHPYAGPGCGECYDFALMRKYPFEAFCWPEVFADLRTQHTPTDAEEARQLDVVAVFRAPDARIVSAFRNALHSSGFSQKQHSAMRTRCLKKGWQQDLSSQRAAALCFARTPGITGCYTRLLSGGPCASPDDAEPADAARLSAASKTLEGLAFVGLTEDWNETVCRFHRRFGSVPQQGEFLNRHRGRGSAGAKGADVRARVDDASDWTLFRLAGERIETAARDPCHRQAESSACVPRSCAEAGAQCGEIDDGCGGTRACGLCVPDRDGLPSTWRFRCSQNQCVRTCPGPWDALWRPPGAPAGGRSASDPTPAGGPRGAEATALRRGAGLSPAATSAWLEAVAGAGASRPADDARYELASGKFGWMPPGDAVLLCADACEQAPGGRSRDAPGADAGPSEAARFARRFCSCGERPRAYLQSRRAGIADGAAAGTPPALPGEATKERGHGANAAPPTAAAYASAHDFGRLLRIPTLPDAASQPLCCGGAGQASINPRVDTKAGERPPRGWRRGTVDADFRESVELGCGSFAECERAARSQSADVAVVSNVHALCFLGWWSGEAPGRTLRQSRADSFFRRFR
jgi:hypothetical protein